MRHRVAGKKLSRTPSHHKAMRRNMAASLIEHGAIRTTEAKAKELRRFVERLITAAKSDTVHARRRVVAALGDRDMFDEEGELLEHTVVQKLFAEIAPRFANRPGGYTRIIRVSDKRIGDSGQQVILQLMEESAAEEKSEERPSRRRRRAAKRQAAAEAGEEAQGEKQPSAERQEPPAEDQAEPEEQQEEDK